MTTGLRERKKQQTREHISNIATGLFVTQGFERTTIAEVADAAEVAKMTVTNYFPLKEDLVFDRHDEIAGLLADAVRERAAGVSVLAAVSGCYLDRVRQRDPIMGFVGPLFAALVADSPALMARERQILSSQEDALAEVLTAEFGSSPADVRPRIAAVQLGGVVRVLYYEGRRRLIAAEPTDAIAAALRRAARTAFDAVGPTLPAAYR